MIKLEIIQNKYTDGVQIIQFGAHNRYCYILCYHRRDANTFDIAHIDLNKIHSNECKHFLSERNRYTVQSKYFGNAKLKF